MRRRMMKSKIHRATVTDANIDYVGSITVDRELMDLADLYEYEQVAVVDVDNGARLETYVIEGEPGSGAICLNGAAAHLIHPGDKVIIISYAEYDDAELRSSGGHEPTIVHVDTANRPISQRRARQLAGDRSYTEVPALADPTPGRPSLGRFTGEAAANRPNVVTGGDLAGLHRCIGDPTATGAH